MTNDKGTRNETRLVRWLHQNGFGHADRLTKTGQRDRGDVLLCPGVMAEVKAWDLALVVPTAGQLVEWMEQTEREAEHGRHDVAFLVVKRRGTQDPGRWFAYIAGWRFRALLGGDLPMRGAGPVMLSVADLVTVLRSAGWGDQLEDRTP